jgi:hypothetical protein
VKGGQVQIATAKPLPIITASSSLAVGTDSVPQARATGFKQRRSHRFRDGHVVRNPRSKLAQYLHLNPTEF